RAAGDYRIDDGGDHEEAGNRDAGTRNRQRTADEPEDGDECDRGQDRVQHADREVDGRIDRNPQIIRDASLGIRVVAGDEGELVVPTTRDPVVEHTRV